MRKNAAKALIIAFALCMAPVRAFAFDGSTDERGSHMQSLRSALAGLYGLGLRAPEKLKGSSFTDPKYRWDPYRATDLMSDAARDADWNFFAIPAAHAQTPEFDYGRRKSAEALRAIESRALLDYFKFLDEWIRKARAAFLDGRSVDGLYYVGFATHCYQDLWAHRGMTNAMHKALLERAKLDVDRDPERIAAMERRLPGWLAALPDLLGPEASGPYLDALLSNPVIVRPNAAKRAKLLGRRRDVYWEATMYALFQGTPKASLERMEKVEWDAEALDGVLLDPEEFAAAAAMKKPEPLARYLESRGYAF